MYIYAHLGVAIGQGDLLRTEECRHDARQTRAWFRFGVVTPRIYYQLVLENQLPHEIVNLLFYYD